MKRNTLFKRVLAMLLAVMMLLTVTPLTAFATGETITEEGGEINVGDTNGELDEDPEDTDEPEIIIGTPISTLEELEEELQNGTEAIAVLADLVLDHTLYITSNVTIYSEEAVSLSRAPDFAGDLFVVGQYADGTLCETDVILSLGRETDTQSDLLIIDGNKANVTANVVGSALFVCDPGHVIVYGSVAVVNHKKVGNERTSHENVTVSYPVKVGGAAAIVAAGGMMDIYGGRFDGNEVNTVADDEQTCLQGGAIYNYGTLNVYDGTFDDNHAYFGGAFFNYRTMNVCRATISNNVSASAGGAIYVPNSTAAFTNLGVEHDGVESHVTLTDNQSGSHGGAIHARNEISVSNTMFKGNENLDGEGGAIYAATVEMAMENVIFAENISAGHGSAVYLTGSNENDEVLELSAKKVTFRDNTATDHGALYITSGARAALEEATFTNNTSTSGAAVFVSGGTLDVNGATFTANTAANKGGAIYSQETSAVTLNAVTATENKAKDGGVMYVTDTVLNIYDSTFTANTTTAASAVLGLYSGAATGIYGCTFTDNQAGTNAGAITSYAGEEVEVIVHNCSFINNSCLGSGTTGFGGALHISGKTQLKLYCITAVGNHGDKGGFMYETTAGTVVTVGGLTLTGNTATTGGNNIWGNTYNAKLYLDQSKCVENDYAGVRDDAYWTAFVVNKLTTTYQTVEVPNYFNYFGVEIIPNVPVVPVDVTTAEELEDALASANGIIRLMADITLDRTLYVTKDTTIFGVSAYTITRAAGFAGDLFVVGQKADGQLCAEGITLNLGREEGTANDRLIIDGNKSNLTVDVVGSALFVCDGAHVNLYKEVTLQNHKKVGNERTSHENVTVSYPVKVGGAAIILANGSTMDIYGSRIVNNEVNTVSDDNQTCLQGGAIYNYGTLNIYDGTFEGNQAYFGGAIFNYRRLNLYKGVVSNNTSADCGGAIYMPNSTASYTKIGVKNDVVEPNVVFSGNRSGSHGGAIYARNSIAVENTLFENNANTSGYGGAITAFTVRMTMDNVTFRNNTATSVGGAVYLNGSNGKEEVPELSAKNVTFENNSGSNGGAMYLSANVRAYLKNATFTGNSAGNGGAVYGKGSSLEIDGATFANNTATTKAGGIYCVKDTAEDESDIPSTMVLNKINATGNSAADGGFGYVSNTDLQIFASHFKGNTASASTAVIYLATGAKTKIYGTTFEENVSAKNGGAITAYTYDAGVLIQDCAFLNNVCNGFGGAMHISGRTQLTLYDITATGNSATHGGFMYETTAGTVVTLVSLNVQGNTASTGGPVIWGNTLNAKLYIDKSKVTDGDHTGAYDDAYWAAAIVNKLTVYDINAEVPKYLDYNNEDYPKMQDAVDVYTAAELETAINAGHKHIRIVDDFEVDRTFYITEDVTIFSTFPRTLTRAADFGGDIFVVGENAAGEASYIKNGTPTLVLGNPDSVQENLLTIDGNKDNMTVDVVGSVLFVAFSGTANLYTNVTVCNARKVGNERIYSERYVTSSAERVGGAFAAVISGTLNIYGGNYLDNEGAAVTQAEDGSNVYLAVYGGAIYNYSTTRIYGGRFSGNVGAYGAVVVNYRILEIIGGVFENNHATTRGGVVHVVDTASAHTYIGTIPEAGVSQVTFRNNMSDGHGGAIFSSQLAALVIYEGALFDGNYAVSSGGAICAYGQLTAYATTFKNNVAGNRGGAVYFSNNNSARVVRHLKFENCIFENNQGYYGGALSGYASAEDYEQGGIAEVIDCTFTGNRAAKLTEGTTKAAGGAIFADRRCAITVTGSAFSNNTAELEGGALYAAGETDMTVDNCTIDGSSADKHGGAITIRSSYFTMTDTAVSDSSSVKNGGAVYVSYESNREMNSKVNIDNCTFENNCSTEGYGGAIYATKRALENEHPVLTVKNTDFVGNTALSSGGTLFVASGLDAYLKNVNIADSISLEGKGGALYTKGGIIEYDTGSLTGNSAAVNTGGAFAFEDGSIITLNNLTVTGNVSGAGAGAMYAKNATVKVYNSAFKENTAATNGGAIYGQSALQVYNTLFEDNHAVGNGGAVTAYSNGQQMTMQDCTLLNNKADGYGGGIYASGSSLLDIYDVTATGNNAAKGGFLYETTTGTVVTLSGLTLSGNTATEAPIIWGNSTGAVLKINKQNYTDSDHSGDYGTDYWANAIVNALTVEEVATAVPTYTDFVARKEDTAQTPVTRPVVSVDEIFNLAENSSDASINSVYDALPRLDNSSNFMSNNVTVFEDINGGDVLVDTIVYPAHSAESNMNFSQGMLIYQAMLYKQAHPDEDVNIHITSYRFSVQAALCLNRDSRYFGYMRQMPTNLNYDQYGFVRIAYLLVTAAKMGINVTVVGHQDAYPQAGKTFVQYFDYYLDEPCDPQYVDGNALVSEYLSFNPIQWTLQNKGGTDMMHLKLCAVSDYLDMNGVEHHNAVWTSSSNLDGITSDGYNANWKQQTAIITTNHADLYRIAVNYVDLMTGLTGQEDIYEFQHILNYRSTRQIAQILAGQGADIPADQQLVYLGSETDDVFELYFTPMGGGVLEWDETTNAYCKYIREMYESEDSIIFIWNAAEYNGGFALGQQLEMMITAAFHDNRNADNMVYMNTESFTGESFNDLELGKDIGLKSFNKKELGGIHNKDVHISYVKDGQRYYVSLMNSMNVHSGSMYYQANHMLVIKETDCDEDSVFFTVTDRTTCGIVEHDYGETQTCPATAEEHGYYYQECRVCGKEKRLDVIHYAGEWSVNSNGIQYRTCTVCGDMTDSRFIGEDSVKLLCYNELIGREFTQTPNALISSPTVKTPLTLEALIHLPKGTATRGGVIVGSYTGGKENQINLEVYFSGKLRLYYKVDGATVNYNFKTDVRSEKPLHIALTINGLEAMLYLDGVLVETATLSRALPEDVTNFVIGGDYRADNTQYFRGKVYGVNLFEDVRTAEEILLDKAIVTADAEGLLYSAYFNETEQLHLHTFDYLCDETCDVCGYINEEAQHAYSADCDVDCDMCGGVREAAEHTYDHQLDVDCNACGAVRMAELPVTFGGNSVSEDVSGLAFLFRTEIDGIAIEENTHNVADFTNATIGGYKLLRMGAIASNNVSQTDIAAVYVYDQSDGVTSFAYRVIEIPEDQLDTTVTMIPYFVVEIDGEEVTLYGEAQNATYRQVRGE